MPIFHKINALMNAYDAGVITTIQTQLPLKALEQSNMVGKLVSRFSMQEDPARWAVDQWIAAVDQTVLREMEAARRQRENEQENPSPCEKLRVLLCLAVVLLQRDLAARLPDFCFIAGEKMHDITAKMSSM